MDMYILLIKVGNRVIEERIYSSEDYIKTELLIYKEMYENIPNIKFYKGVIKEL